jgi:hypothetical protein
MKLFQGVFQGSSWGDDYLTRGLSDWRTQGKLTPRLFAPYLRCPSKGGQGSPPRLLDSAAVCFVNDVKGRGGSTNTRFWHVVILIPAI